jgi:AraC-like DNA-binding protein
MQASARIGRETWHAGVRIPRHRHAQAYAALVLRGGYEECGSRGRFRVGPGDVLLHGAFDAHLDRFDASGTEILNLPIPDSAPFACGRVADPDAIAKIAQTDPAAASAHLCRQAIAARPVARDWPDLLAADLLDDPNLRLDAWALAHNLAAETVSRGFGRLFALTPAAFRAEARARRALTQIVRSALPLAAIAAMTGFADQAHMTRAIGALTGASPQFWRRSNPFKTEAICAG